MAPHYIIISKHNPIPGPLSRWFHFLPRLALKIGVWFNWLAELIAPFFIFWPKIARHIAGVIIVLFQITLILSGNLSFLNWLTIIPALACFDDSFWAKILPKTVGQQANDKPKNGSRNIHRRMLTTSWSVVVIIAFT